MANKKDEMSEEYNVAWDILAAINKMTDDKEVFTASDISKAVGEETNNNAEMVLNNEFNTGQIANYNRKFCNEEYVYYPDGKNPSDHPLFTK